MTRFRRLKPANSTSFILRLICSGLLFVVLPGHASEAASGKSKQPLVFAYWDNATPPFAIRQGDQLVGGIIHDIGQNLAQRLGVHGEYKLLPPKRIERELIAGGVDLDCVTNPVWKESPGAYPWSPVLFDGADRFLVKKSRGLTINSREDLKGLRIGVYADYVYQAEITLMLDNELAQRVIVNDLAHGVRLLLAERIDTLIDFGVLLSYEIKTHNEGNKLALAKFPADEFQLMCAYSPKMRLDKVRVDAELRAMVHDKTMEQILGKYR